MVSTESSSPVVETDARMLTLTPGGLEPESRTKLAQLVAQRIVDDIVKRGWPVNESLGAEPELMARYSVSRAVLREAIRLVEHMGIATMRRGPRGGLIITASSVGAVTDAIAIFLETEVVNLDDLAEARVVLELQAVRLAADRLDTAGTEALLRVPMEQEGAGFTPDAGEADLHLAVARATGNPVLLLFIDALGRLERRYMTAGWTPEHQQRLNVPAALAQAHRAIADAVISGDGLLARHRMLTHLESVARFVRTYGSDPGGLEWPLSPTTAGAPAAGPLAAGVSSLGAPAAGPLAAGAPSLEAPAAGTPLGRDGDPSSRLVPGTSAVISDGRKLGEVTAARIRRDIARRRAPVGTNLGSESVLLATYGVSRSVLREAVRLLEYHSVARMRRGPGGGLVVVKPDPEAVIRAVALYLQSVQVDSRSLFEARDTIELASVAYAVERLQPSGVDALREALAAEQGGSAVPRDQGYATLHAAIAELTGNRILSLFTQILLSLTAASVAASHAEVGSLGARHQAHQIHEGIVTAILSGDSALARRRMRVHLWDLEKRHPPADAPPADAPHADAPPADALRADAPPAHARDVGAEDATDRRGEGGELGPQRAEVNR